jgi:hypothetical protein
VLRERGIDGGSCLDRLLVVLTVRRERAIADADHNRPRSVISTRPARQVTETPRDRATRRNDFDAHAPAFLSNDAFLSNSVSAHLSGRSRQSVQLSTYGGDDAPQSMTPQWLQQRRADP